MNSKFSFSEQHIVVKIAIVLGVIFFIGYMSHFIFSLISKAF
jgi:hypothetical protein